MERKNQGDLLRMAKDPISNLPTSRGNLPADADLPSDGGKAGDVAPSPNETATESLVGLFVLNLKVKSRRIKMLVGRI